ncbi:MAG TPA: WYL domain-containing protein [Nocardioidaceae bacterium]|nr:WYL domain-containing protein [Nocardioidaceae bacterium]
MSKAAKSQVERLLALVPYLRERGGVRIDRVAHDFGVTAQQIQDDLNVLWFCGLPGAMPGDLIDVDMDALEGEGVVHVDNTDFLDRPLRLDAHQALALIVALRTLREVAGSGERDAIDRALVKLENAAGDAGAIVDQVEVQIDGADQQVTDTVSSALQHKHRLRMSYFVPARDETTHRDVDPMRLVMAEGHTYLEAWCRRTEDTRMFRLDRVTAAEELDVPADPPPQAQPRDLSEGLFQPAPDDMLATVELVPGARWVADYYPHEGAEDLPDGRLRLRLRVSDPAWLVRLALRLGGQARVVIPSEVAQRVRQEAERALRAYAH